MGEPVAPVQDCVEASWKGLPTLESGFCEHTCRPFFSPPAPSLAAGTFLALDR